MLAETPLQLVSVFAFIAQGGLGPYVLRRFVSFHKKRNKLDWLLLILYIILIAFFLAVQLYAKYNKN